MIAALVVAIVAVGIVGMAVLRARQRERRRLEARSVALELMPEIRSLVDTEATGTSRAERYEARQAAVHELFSKEQAFAVDNFYGCVAAYRRAQAEMTAAFSEDDERSLGDRIRAKDARDRCLKDVFYTGEAALQHLERSARE